MQILEYGHATPSDKRIPLTVRTDDTPNTGMSEFDSSLSDASSSVSHISHLTGKLK